MVRAQFHQTNHHLALKQEGRVVSARAVEVKSLVSRHFVPNGLLVDVSEVTYVDPAGEQLFLWLRDLQAKFVAETCHARDIRESLQLTLQEDADRSVPSLTEMHHPQAAPSPARASSPDSPGRGPS
jgi:hypothetical protein